MKKSKTINKPNQTDYWGIIYSTLGTYEEKLITETGKIELRTVDTNYFLSNQTWNLLEISKIPNFISRSSKLSTSKKLIHFKALRPSINAELKYFFFIELFMKENQLSTLYVTYYFLLNTMVQFLNTKYSSVDSILELNIDKVEIEWGNWLMEKKRRNNEQTNLIHLNHRFNKTKKYKFLRSVHNELLKITDTRTEWEKDRWDIRELNKQYIIQQTETHSEFYLDFSKIKNSFFKNLLKKYLKHKLIHVGRSLTWATAKYYARKVTVFLNYISTIEPTWNDLNKLNRSHIEQYLLFLRESIQNYRKQKNSNATEFIRRSIKTTYSFIRDIESFEYPEAPIIPTRILLYREDNVKETKKPYDSIDHIPDFVLEQLFQYLNKLNPDLQPIIWIAFKTGLRIGDVLSLKQDSLIQLNGKYFIQADISKMYIKGHKLPIDDHLANLLAVLIDQSIKNSNDDNNPNRYVFVRYTGLRKGKPYLQTWVQNELNSFAIKTNIVDESGKIFHFKMHQFRHTYAVKMLNSGANIVVVQDLLAHASPEMTLRYARVLEDTKRKAFEQAVNNGVFTFDLNGEIHNVQEDEEVPKDILEMLWRDEKLNAVDNPYGTCHARVNGNCPVAKEPPCLTANDGKPCFDLAVGTTSFDVKKYELWIESTSKVIEAAKEYGRPDVIEHNQKNLERYQEIYNTIKNGNIIFGRIERIKKKVDESGKKGV